MEGKKSDPSIQALLGLFPRHYATFEVIMLIRIFYFLCFNIISAISITYVVDDVKERTALGHKMKENQDTLQKLSYQILSEY